MYSQRKKCNDEIEGNHSSLKINETTNSKSKTQVVFYTFLSLSNNMAHSSTLLPLHLGLQVILVSSQRKEGKKKVLFSWKSCLSWLSTKKELPAGSNPGERIYNHSVKRQHPLLERNWESITRSWKDSEPALELVFAISVWLCVCTRTVQMCL